MLAAASKTAKVATALPTVGLVAATPCVAVATVLQTAALTAAKWLRLCPNCAPNCGCVQSAKVADVLQSVALSAENQTAVATVLQTAEVVVAAPQSAKVVAATQTANVVALLQTVAPTSVEVLAVKAGMARH